MTTIDQAYAIFLTLSCCAGLFAFWKYGKRFALGPAMAVSVLAGTWFLIPIAGIPFDVRSSVAVIFLVLFCLHSGRYTVRRWNMIDMCLGGIVATHVISDSVQDGFSWKMAAMAYGEWVLPYAAGRYAMQFRGSIGRVAPWFLGIAALLGATAAWECWTNINPWETLFVEVDDKVKRVHGTRYGYFHRAIGPTRHPIFFGVLLMLMIPWIAACWEAARTKGSKCFVTVAGLLVVLGIFSTVSRGPILAVPLIVLLLCSAEIRWVRPLVVAMLLIGCGVFYMLPGKVIEALDANVREAIPTEVVEVDGQQKVYTGTTSRLFVVRIYGPLVGRAGPLGFGTDACSTFPPNIPGLPASAKSREVLGIVDNSFILQGLRFGWLGLFFMVALFLSVIGHAFAFRRTASTFLEPHGRLFVTTIACVFIAVGLELLTVFWAYDMSFWVLFHLGVVSGLKSQMDLSIRGELPEEGTKG